MHGGVGHGPQVDEETKLVASEILCQVHVGPARVRVRVEVTGEFIPHVSTADALGVDPAGHTVDCNFHFGYVRVEIAFRVPGARRVGVDEQQEDALERPALWVHLNVQYGVPTP